MDFVVSEWTPIATFLELVGDYLVVRIGKHMY